MLANPTQKQTLVELQNRLQAWERRAKTPQHCITTGCDGLDALFPSHGIRQGSLVEWVGEADTGGATMLSLLVGRRLGEADHPAILIDLQQQIYPVALSLFGFDLSTLVVVHPRSEREALWACEESLRSKAVGLVWARIERLAPLAFRRLQLAAEESGGVGFLVRSAPALQQPSWADVRLRVSPRPAYGEAPGFHIEVAYSHGKPPRSVAEVEVDALRGTLHEIFAHQQTHRMSLVS